MAEDLTPTLGLQKPPVSDLCLQGVQMVPTLKISQNHSISELPNGNTIPKSSCPAGVSMSPPVMTGASPSFISHVLA
jgi:hypothetical protein